MKRTDMTKLATLARIDLSDNELDTFASELSQIVDYVSVVSDIAANEADTAKQPGARYNILRDDVVTNEPDQFTSAALREMPQTHGRHLLVKRIMKAK